MRRLGPVLLAIGLLCGALSVTTATANADLAGITATIHLDHPSADSPALLRSRSRDTGPALVRHVEATLPASGSGLSLLPAHATTSDAEAAPLAEGLGRRAPSRAPPR